MVPMGGQVMIALMRKELTDIGIKELRTANEVDDAFKNMQGTALIVVNSVCGCAAGAARPGVAIALKNSKSPQHLYTVFAGQDQEATAQARTYFSGFTPSSPSFAILKDGSVVQMIPREEIQGHTPEQIAEKLVSAFNSFC